MKLKSTFSLFLIMCLIGTIEAANLSLPAIFSDNMVLQRDTEVTFWGRAEANSTVTIKTEWNDSIETTATEYGVWEVKVPTPEAGGPYDVEVISGDESIKYTNVLIGEVWLCSGQSNMEMPLKGWPPANMVNNSDEVIANSANPRIRFFTVARAYSGELQYDCKGSWVESTPETAADFSATAYFFGKKVYEKLNIPIGLIHSSWGGTPVEAWTSKKYLEDVDEYKELLANMKEYNEEAEVYIKWLKDHKTIDVSGKDALSRWKDLDFNDAALSSPDYSTDGWGEMELPTLWEGVDKVPGNFDGAIWFKKDIEIPSDWVNKDLVLELGPIDDMDITYVNGKKVGEHMEDGFYNKKRIYDVPAGSVKDNKLNISVRALDTQGGGGLFGKKEQLNIHPKGSDEKISLAGMWKYLPIAEYRGMDFYVFDAESREFFSRPEVTFEFTAYTPMALFNAMINPLIPYTIRGAIWYQGEANVGDAKGYEELFPLMIKNWRSDWKLGNFPFYFVQIAPYNYGPDVNSAELRDAQRKSLSVPNTGMAVTMDIGNVDDIHPGNKQDVGERLARWALAKTYDVEGLDFSGPLYKSMDIKDSKAVVTFDNVNNLVYKPEAGTAEFMIAGKDGVFKKAEVETDGNKLLLSSPEVAEPAAVRYGWSNDAIATLFDENGLPASSFSTGN